MEPAVGIDGVQPAAHVLDHGAKTRQSVRFEIDVAEFDGAGAGGPDQPLR